LHVGAGRDERVLDARSILVGTEMLEVGEEIQATLA
jgi:hypothetical protein